MAPASSPPPTFSQLSLSSLRRLPSGDRPRQSSRSRIYFRGTKRGRCMTCFWKVRHRCTAARDHPALSAASGCPRAQSVGLVPRRQRDSTGRPRHVGILVWQVDPLLCHTVPPRSYTVYYESSQPSGALGEISRRVMAGLSQRAMASARPLRRLPSPVTRSRNPRGTPRRSAMHLARAAAVERPPRPPSPLRAADGTLIVTARFVQGRRG
jgi:hypothetical protein